MNHQCDLEKKLETYLKGGLLNTIFFGRGNKNKVIFKMLNPNNDTETENRWENRVTFYSTNNYIRFDSRDFIKNKSELISILGDLSKNKTITPSQYSNIFFVQNLNCLDTKQQEGFRQIIEDAYHSRFIFTCENIDSLDPALISRCSLIQIRTDTQNYINSDTEYHKNILKHMGIIDPEKTMTNILLREIKSSDSLKKIHAIADKIHTSEIDIINTFKESENIIPSTVYDLQKYATIKNPTQFDTLLLLLKIKKALISKIKN